MSNLTHKSIAFEITAEGEKGYVNDITLEAGVKVDLTFKINNLSTLSLKFNCWSPDQGTAAKKDAAINIDDFGDLSWQPEDDDIIEKDGDDAFRINIPEGSEKEFYFTLKGFKVSDVPGISEIMIFESRAQIASLHITKVKDAPVIKSFTADEYFILSGTSITLSWDAENADSYELYDNRGKVKLHSPTDTSYITDELKSDVEYTLYAKNDADEIKDSLSITTYDASTVKTTFLQFPPKSRILGIYSQLVENEMYALVQKKGETLATLFRSTSNVLKRWKVVYVNKNLKNDGQNGISPATIPMEIATRPGLIYDDKLWLIGGSTYDPDAPGNTFGYFDLDNNKWVDLGVIKHNGKDMIPRMGHGCVLHKGDIWVFGGYNPDHLNALNDVWQYKYKDNTWSKLDTTLPKGKCMMAACNRIENNKEEIWMYGGYEDMPAGKISFDLYCMRQNGVFESIPFPATEITDYESVSIAADDLGRLYLFAKYVYHLYLDNNIAKIVLRSTITDWQYRSNGHYLQTVPFQHSIWINSVHFPRGSAYDAKLSKLSYGYFVN